MIADDKKFGQLTKIEKKLPNKERGAVKKIRMKSFVEILNEQKNIHSATMALSNPVLKDLEMVAEIYGNQFKCNPTLFDIKPKSVTHWQTLPEKP